MPIKKWIVQYIIAFPIVFTLLASVQYLKGQTIDYSITFGVFWAFISILVFAARRVYIFQKNIPCALCNDLPLNELDEK